MAATHSFFHDYYSWSTSSSFCTFFNPMPPLPSAWLRQQTISWMGNLLASIPRLDSASTLLFCDGKNLDVLRDSVIFFCPCVFNLSTPSSCFSSAVFLITNWYNLQSTAFHGFSETLSPRLIFLLFSGLLFSLFHLLCSGIKIYIQRGPQGIPWLSND